MTMRLNATSHPVIYEVNTRVFLRELSVREEKPITLSSIPDSILDDWAELGFDAVWMMGVWTTGAIGRDLARSHEGLLAEYRRVLPDVTPEDIGGSPYAIKEYTVARQLGGKTGLQSVRRRLKARGIALILDFVPNHTARDCPLLVQHPEYYVQGTAQDLSLQPELYFELHGKRRSQVIAYGRDPMFPGWTDTAQLNHRHAGMRRALITQLEEIAALCDGIRCDMAMLVLREVFEKTWGERARPAPGGEAEGEFWVEAITRVRANNPTFRFIAESYWNREWDLQQLGFDYTYDKTLYDRLLREGPAAVRDHLRAALAFQSRCVRFIENHDEQRAAAAMSTSGWDYAAAVVSGTVPGAVLFHEGQIEGRRVKVPVQLTRRPEELPVRATQAFYRNLLRCLKDEVLRQGEWQLLEVRPAWNENPSWQDFLAFWWRKPGVGARLVVVNYAPHSGQCYVDVPVGECQAAQIEFRDLLGEATYVRDKAGLGSKGMYFDLTPYGAHIFEAQPCYRR